MTDVRSNVPDFTTPIIGPDGRVDRAWWHFFLKMFARTGGTSGVDIAALAAEVDAEKASAQSFVPNDAAAQIGQLFLEAMAVAQVQILQSRNTGYPEAAVMVQRLRVDAHDQVAMHGIQYDPGLHAVATTTTAGFMSAADKAKLDAL